MRNLRESENVFLKGNWYPVEESASENLDVYWRNSKRIKWFVSQKRA